MKLLSTTFLALGLATLPMAAKASNHACSVPDNVNQLASEIAAGVNANRSANGKSQLRFNRQLGQAAMTHACDMSQRGFFGHTGSGGTNVQARVRSAGYRDCMVGENLAWGYPRSEQIVGGWMKSPAHRAIMLNDRVTEFGVAITDGAKGPNWVLVVADTC